MKLIVAIDSTSITEALILVSKLHADKCMLKIGIVFFTLQDSHAAIANFIADGFKIFLDLKFHDIPNTVYYAIKAAVKLGVWMINVHAAAGKSTLLAAKSAITEHSNAQQPLLIAVTILTSVGADDLQDTFKCAALKLTNCVQALAKLSYDCGLDGVVCSGHEIADIKQHTNPNFLTVVPGVRDHSLSSLFTQADDQVRCISIAQAQQADYLVIGRPITQSSNPTIALAQLYELVNAPDTSIDDHIRDNYHYTKLVYENHILNANNAVG